MNFLECLFAPALQKRECRRKFEYKNVSVDANLNDKNDNSVLLELGSSQFYDANLLILIAISGKLNGL